MTTKKTATKKTRVAPKALDVDVDQRDATVIRLKRIEGQVRGLQKMVSDERYCADVLDQIAAVQQALRGVSQTLVKRHLHHCALAALSGDDDQKRGAMIEELVEMIGR